MKATNYILLILFFGTTLYLISDSLSFNAKTGDEALDIRLKEVNNKALTNITDFKIKMAASFQTSEAEISDLLKIMEPAEILFAYQVATVTGKSLDNIVATYLKKKNEGWSEILKNYGINNKSEKFADIKNLAIFKKINIGDKNISQIKK
jgi:hypothetical protein